MLVAVTKNGKKCKIPFKYHKNGPKYNKCTPIGTTNGLWCATSVDENMVYKTWEWCSVEEGSTLINILLSRMSLNSKVLVY